MALTNIRTYKLWSLLRKHLKRRQASANTILAENGYQLLAENGQFLRTEQ